MRLAPSFTKAIEFTGNLLRDTAQEVKGTRWQSTDVSDKPEMRMKEILNHSFQVPLGGSELLDHWRNDIRPNLPWADIHFLERVGGEPLNPGRSWEDWPWALAADKHRHEDGGKFSHTYMERYWPKRANGAASRDEDEHMQGIRYPYGDLNDVISHLLKDPLSRQAFLPVWFPEDTGVVHGERVPCTLGYHWIMRHGYLHTTYYIRSCDFVRHFRDDLYLSVRLSIWLLDQLRETELRLGEDVPAADQSWHEVKLGLFTFHCVSMHCFVNDWNRMYAQKATQGAG